MTLQQPHDLQECVFIYTAAKHESLNFATAGLMISTVPLLQHHSHPQSATALGGDYTMAGAL